MKRKLWLIAAGLMAAATGGAQTNFSVTSPNGFLMPYYFAVSGPGVNPMATNPPLTLAAGNTYTFSISTAANFHQVDITTGTAIPYSASYYSGASAQVVSSGTITLTIPATNYPSTLYYLCDRHGFFGQINVVAPVDNPPPSNSIIAIVLTSTNVTITSSGTVTTYSLVPQYNSNLVSGMWLDVPSFTNNFAGGTNTTVFDRLEPICGPDVFIRISQRPPN